MSTIYPATPHGPFAHFPRRKSNIHLIVVESPLELEGIICKLDVIRNHSCGTMRIVTIWMSHVLDFLLIEDFVLSYNDKAYLHSLQILS